VFLGIGTGHTAMRVMGQNPMPVKEFREYLRVVRALLNNQAVDYTYRGKTAEIVWQNHGTGFRNTEDFIPIYVAANGPLALKAAGAYGDGLVSLFNEQPEILRSHLAQVETGAGEMERTLPDDFHTTALTNAVILQPGEKLTDDRVIEMSGSYAMCAVHFVYEIWHLSKNDEVVPDFMHGIWEDYCDHVEQFQIPVEDRHQVLHEGHCSYYTAGERHFITPELIEGTHLIGEPGAIVEQLRAAEDNGLNEVSLIPPLAHVREAARDFAEQVMPLL
jgi:alkanesulfonate monooxygenase SsuD/methylene tetrahydromethanopterin reductase-like flavin-dependent oxidoreductase (luciferase family)